MNTQEQEFHATRQTCLGGSDAAAIVGVSKWRTDFDVWLEKTGRAPPIDDTDAMYWGRVLEEPVAAEYAKRKGVKIRRRGFIRDQKRPHMGANLDRVIVGHEDGPGVLECKTAGAYTAADWGPDGTDQIPEYYLPQVAHYAAVTGYTWAAVAVLIGGSDFRTYDIPRQDLYIDALIEIEAKWWRDHVVADIPPTPQTAANILALWPQDDGTEVVADDLALAHLQRLRELKGQAKQISEQVKEAENDIKRVIQEATTLVSPDGQKLATWKAQESTRLDVKAVRAALGNEAHLYEKTTKARVLRIK